MNFIECLTQIKDIDMYKLFKKEQRDRCTYPVYYQYWIEQLFERLMRLFVWDNTGEVEPKEIEQRLILAGHLGVAEYKGELTAFYGSFYGVTKYLDEFTHYNVHCPIYSGSYKIGKDIVIINNTSLRNKTFEHVEHYASLLAHADVTLMQLLVSARDSGGIPICKTQSQYESIQAYHAKLFNGQLGAVQDISQLGIEYGGGDRKTQQDIVDVFEVRAKLLKAFYADIGVKASFEKRSNTVTDEVTADDSMLLYNVDDMLKCRQKGANAVNSMFGTNWSVRLSDELKYREEVKEVEKDVPKQ